MTSVRGHTRASGEATPGADAAGPAPHSPLSPTGPRQQCPHKQTNNAGAGHGGDDLADDHEQHRCDQAGGQDCSDPYDHGAGSATRPGTCNWSRARAAVCRGEPCEHEVHAPTMRVGHAVRRVVDMPKRHLALLEWQLVAPAEEASAPGVGVIFGDFYGCRVSVGRIRGLGYMEGT